MESIAIFVSTLGAGGAEKQAALLAKVLSTRYDVHFVALYGDYEKSDFVMSILKKAGVKVYPLLGPKWRKLKEFAKILRDNHVVCSLNYLTQCDFLGSVVESRCGVKRIYNGIRNSDLKGWKTILERISHNYIATATIFNCYSGEEAFRKKGLKAEKCVTIPNCFQNISEFMMRDNKEEKRIITVGRFVPQKDYETVVKTVAELKKLRKDFVLDLCGYGALDAEIRKWVKLYDVEDVVEFHIKPNNIPELLQQADVYLSTSLFEGTSNSIMEALNWSLPVVATNVGDNDHLVIDRENGTLHPIGDAEGMAISLNKLLSSVALRNEMGAKSNKNLRENYSIEIFEKRYLKLIESV